MLFPENMQSFAKQNEYIEAEFHRLYKYYNTGQHLYTDLVKIVKPDSRLLVMHCIRGFHPTVEAPVFLPDPDFYV